MNVFLYNRDMFKIYKERKLKFLVPFVFGVLITLNVTIWTIINGGRWFEPISPTSPELPEYYNSLNRVFGPFYMLGYFTIQSNFFLGIMLIIYSFKSLSKKVQTFFFGSVVFISITFLVYWSALAFKEQTYKWNSVYYQFYNLFTHLFNPLFGISILFYVKKDLIINKKTLGKLSLYMSIFVVMNAFFYGAGSIVVNGELESAYIYSFLDLKKILFINLTNLPALSFFINILLVVVAPLIFILISFLLILSTKVKIENNYFEWFLKFKVDRRK